jgi:hypothetical protein
MWPHLQYYPQNLLAGVKSTWGTQQALPAYKLLSFTLYSPCILSYIIAFILTNTCTTPCRHIYPYKCFDYLLVIIRGIKVYKHRLHIHYNSWFTFIVKIRWTMFTIKTCSIFASVVKIYKSVTNSSPTATIHNTGKWRTKRLNDD